jgi:peptide/nickel transport system permease protein
MLRFVSRRILFLVFVMLGVSIITFLIVHIAPGDPARMIAGPAASAEAVAKVRLELGLDQSIATQYLAYLGNLLRFDLGTSIVSGAPVLDEILSRAPASLELMGAAVLVGWGLGIPLGIMAAMRPGGWLDRMLQGLAVLGSSVPAFWFGLLLVILFYRELGWFPASGRFTGIPPEAITGFYTIDSLLAGDFKSFRTSVAHLALPVLTLALLDLGIVARLMRNQMIGVMAQDYIRTARASGLRDRTIVSIHALRNAISPLVTILAASIASMLYGSVSLETVFGWPGAGQYVVKSIFALDFPVIVGFAVLTAVLYVLVNAAADLVYGILDPRVRES